MSRETETASVRLGGRDISVSAFTLDQLQAMLPAFARLRLGLAEGGFEAARAILAEALRDALPPDELAAIRTTIVEVLSAVAVIARVSGLAEMGEAIGGSDQA